MAIPTPTEFFDDFFHRLESAFQPPSWAVVEAQRRLVLLLNHVLMQEPEAMQRLARRSGQVVVLKWRSLSMKLLTTPAGLLDLAPSEANSDLSLVLSESSPLALAQAVLRADKPPVQIEGDVQLAAEVSWLVEHVRWDLEEDLSRLIGDAPAHAISEAMRQLMGTLRDFVATRTGRGSGNTTT